MAIWLFQKIGMMSSVAFVRRTLNIVEITYLPFSEPQ
jgi:hypothetical protein